MSLHVSWAGYWWLVEGLGILAILVIWLVPVPHPPARSDHKKQLPPDSTAAQ